MTTRDRLIRNYQKVSLKIPEQKNNVIFYNQGVTD
jgi:hypothetical protein